MHGPAHRHALAKTPVAARRPQRREVARRRARRRLCVAQGRQLAGGHARPSGRSTRRSAPTSRPRTPICEAQLSDTRPLQDELFTEMKGRLKENDSTVPAPDGPFAYSLELHRRRSVPARVPHGRATAAPRAFCSTATSRPRARRTGTSATPSTAPTISCSPTPATIAGPNSTPSASATSPPARICPIASPTRAGPRVGQRQQHALLRAARRASPPAPRLPARRRHAGRGRRARL